MYILNACLILTAFIYVFLNDVMFESTYFGYFSQNLTSVITCPSKTSINYHVSKNKLNNTITYCQEKIKNNIWL